jgi:16S rRNA (uracil1498-N3)-methyltransferase
MRRFFVPPASLTALRIPLEGDTLHHLSTVLRLPPGAEVLLLDGAGTLCHCRLEQLGRKRGEALVLRRWQESETVLPIQLLQSLPKGDKMELILQKGTELGVTEFVPVLAARSTPRLLADREEARQLRWERIIQEAARQSQRPILPRLASATPLAEALERCTAELRLLPWEEESRPLAAVLPARPPASAAVLIGPEGGFSAAEAQQAAAAGFLAVSLGRRILRSETAGFAVATILQHRYGDLGSRVEPAPALPQGEVL